MSLIMVGVVWVGKGIMHFCTYGYNIISFFFGLFCSVLGSVLCVSILFYIFCGKAGI